MRKLLFSFCIMGLFVGTACSDEKDCECTTFFDGDPQGTVTTTIEDGECSSLESSTSSGGFTTEVKCEEK